MGLLVTLPAAHLWSGEEPQPFPLPSDLARGLGGFGVSCVQLPLVRSVGLVHVASDISLLLND